VIEWAKNMTNGGSADPVFATIDWAAGVGIAGHSMGGQATSMSANAACAKKWDIKAAALVHPEIGTLPWGNTGSNISIPVAAFSSSGDHTCPPATTETTMAAFNATKQGKTLPSIYRNVEGWSHLEPVMGAVFENPLLSTWTAAWFKIHLNHDRGEFFDLIYGTGPDSLCHAQTVVDCYTMNAPK
jgi:pimeloyl-ACP methyl ester carboxylesterase